MAYGMVEPSGFGQHFIDGEFAGWGEELKAYYDTRMSDAEKSDLDMIDGFYLTRYSRKFSGNFGPLKAHEMPKIYQTLQSCTSLGALVKLSDRLLAVNTALMHIIESAEPGKHQFWPIRISVRGKKDYPEKYFGMIVGCFLDSFLPGASDPKEFQEYSGNYFLNAPNKKQVESLVLSRSVIGDTHLWREHKLPEPALFFSSKLNDEISKAGLKMPKMFKVQEA